MNRDAFLVILLLALSLAVSTVAGGDSAPAQGELDVIEFRGFQRLINSVDDEVLLAEEMPDIPADADDRWREPGLFFDGVFWGDSTDFASISYNRFNPYSNRDWKHFGGEDTTFPYGSELVGEVGEFLWFGTTRGVVEVAPRDMQHNGLERLTKTMRRIVGLTFNPEHVFSARIAESNSDRIEQRVLLDTDEQRIERFAFTSEGNNSPTRVLWVTFTDSSTLPSEWRLAYKDHARQVAMLTWIKTNSLGGSDQWRLPSEPSDIVEIYEPITAGFDHATIRNFTPDRQWDHPERLLEHRQDANTAAGPRYYTILRIVVAVALFITFLAWLHRSRAAR